MLKPPRAVTIAAGPRLFAIQVPAVTACMRVLDAEEFEKLFPVRALFL